LNTKSETFEHYTLSTMRSRDEMQNGGPQQKRPRRGRSALGIDDNKSVDPAAAATAVFAAFCNRAPTHGVMPVARSNSNSDETYGSNSDSDSDGTGNICRTTDSDSDSDGTGNICRTTCLLKIDDQSYQISLPTMAHPSLPSLPPLPARNCPAWQVTEPLECSCDVNVIPQGALLY
jgi:hypothetical protein